MKVDRYTRKVLCYLGLDPLSESLYMWSRWVYKHMTSSKVYHLVWVLLALAAALLICIIVGARQSYSNPLTLLLQNGTDCQVLPAAPLPSLGMPSHGFSSTPGYAPTYRGRHVGLEPFTTHTWGEFLVLMSHSLSMTFIKGKWFKSHLK